MTTTATDTTTDTTDEAATEAKPTLPAGDDQMEVPRGFVTEATSWEQIIAHARALGPDPALADLDDETVEAELRTVASQIAAAQAHWLELLAEFVIRGRWGEQGARTPADWLSWAVGLASSTAREYVRVALALRSFPATRARFAAGELSYSKVRAITRVPHPELEDVLLRLADAAPASHLDRIVAGLISCQGDRREAPETRRSLTTRYRDDGDGELRLRVPGELLAYVSTLVDRCMQLLDATGQPDEPFADDHTAPPESGPGAREPIAARRADALIHLLELAATDLTRDTTGLDRTTLVLHVDAEMLRSDEDGTVPDVTVPVMTGTSRMLSMSTRVLRRLACDAGVILVPTEDGLPIDVGDRKRHATVALRRALRARDHHCRFPSCTASAHLHAHHIQFWTDDGPTDLDNLVLLCGFHHRLVHHAGWVITHDGRGHVAFAPPGGAPLPSNGTSGGAPAEAAPPGHLAAPGRQRALQTTDWDGSPLDLHAAVDVLIAAIERIQPPPDTALAA